MPSAPRRVALVANELDPLAPGDGVGTAVEAAARRLAADGVDVHLLYAPPTPDAARAREVAADFAAAGITLHLLDSFPDPAPEAGMTVLTPWFLHRADRVRAALEALHARHPFDAVEFAEWQGLAFRAAQAKRCGAAFSGVRLTVRLYGSSQLRRERAHAYVTWRDEVLLDFCERYSFEHADLQLAESDDLWDVARSHGWRVGAESSRPAEASDAAQTPLVTVAVPYYNLPDFLPETLASLAAQTYRHLDVVVVDDGSPDPRAADVFDRMAESYPHFRFVRQANGGLGAARNRALAEAKGEFYLPVDADNVAMPRMVEAFVAALQCRPDAASLACYYRAFRDGDAPDGPPCYYYRPTGGPHFLGALQNVYGDANSVFRTAALRSVGGYTTDRGTGWEDWELFARLANAGFGHDVLPEVLFYYRHRDDSMFRTTSEWHNRRRVLRQFVAGPVPLSPALSAGLWGLLTGATRRAETVEPLRAAHAAERDAERESRRREREAWDGERTAWHAERAAWAAEREAWHAERRAAEEARLALHAVGVHWHDEWVRAQADGRRLADDLRRATSGRAYRLAHAGRRALARLRRAAKAGLARLAAFR